MGPATCTGRRRQGKSDAICHMKKISELNMGCFASPKGRAATWHASGLSVANGTWTGWNVPAGMSRPRSKGLGYRTQTEMAVPIYLG